MVSPFGLRGIILSALNREERQATPALRIQQSTVEIGIAPECVILDVRGTHNDHNEGRVFTNGAPALNVRDIDVLLRKLKAARERARYVSAPTGLCSHRNGAAHPALRS